MVSEGTQTEQWVQAMPFLGSCTSCFCLAISTALLPRGNRGKRKRASPASSCSRMMADGCSQGGWALLGGYPGSPGCPSCGHVCSAQPGWSQSPLGCSSPGVTSPKTFGVAASGWGLSCSNGLAGRGPKGNLWSCTRGYILSHSSWPGKLVQATPAGLLSLSAGVSEV